MKIQWKEDVGIIITYSPLEIDMGVATLCEIARIHEENDLEVESIQRFILRLETVYAKMTLN